MRFIRYNVLIYIYEKESSNLFIFRSGTSRNS